MRLTCISPDTLLNGVFYAPTGFTIINFAITIPSSNLVATDSEVLGAAAGAFIIFFGIGCALKIKEKRSIEIGWNHLMASYLRCEVQKKTMQQLEQNIYPSSFCKLLHKNRRSLEEKDCVATPGRLPESFSFENELSTALLGSQEKNHRKWYEWPGFHLVPAFIAVSFYTVAIAFIPYFVFIVLEYSLTDAFPLGVLGGVIATALYPCYLFACYQNNRFNSLKDAQNKINAIHADELTNHLDLQTCILDYTNQPNPPARQESESLQIPPRETLMNPKEWKHHNKISEIVFETAEILGGTYLEELHHKLESVKLTQAEVKPEKSKDVELVINSGNSRSGWRPFN